MYFSFPSNSPHQTKDLDSSMAFLQLPGIRGGAAQVSR